MPVLDRKSRICLRAICGMVNPCRGICRQPTIRHSPQLASFSRRNATFLRQYATVLRQDATLLRRDATVLRTFVTRRNSDLHQIACDFLTVRIRVGALKKSSSPRTNVRGEFPHTDPRSAATTETDTATPNTSPPNPPRRVADSAFEIFAGIILLTFLRVRWKMLA